MQCLRRAEDSGRKLFDWGLYRLTFERSLALLEFPAFFVVVCVLVCSGGCSFVSQRQARVLCSF